MSGFTDSIVGGIGSLIRQYIKSPNYVAGQSGWSINQDGSVEFNNGTFRGTVIIDSNNLALLVYFGTPALNTLAIAISAYNGSDSYGNYWLRGLNIAVNNIAGSGLLNLISDVTNPLSPGGSLSVDSSGNVHLFIENILELNMYTAPINRFDIIAPNIWVGAGGNQNLQFSGGLQGKYYYEEVDLSAQVIPSSGGFTNLVNLVASHLQSDYGSAFNLATGLWTCPVNSMYDFTVQTWYTAWAGTNRCAIYILDASNNLILGWDTVNSDGRFGISGRRHIAAGTVLHFIVLQTSGAAQTISTTQSFLSIKRDL